MTLFKYVIITFVVFGVSAEDITSSEHEMDLIIDMLLKNEVREYTDSVDNAIEEENIGEPAYLNGVWKCGKCDDIDDSRLVYSETYNIEAIDVEDNSINIQVGLALEKISCVIVSSSVELSTVERVNGNCAGDGATLRITGAGATQCDVNVYV